MNDSPKKLKKSEILGAFKADLKAADTLRSQMADKVAEWKAAYDGELYGNEEKGKSKIVSRDIKRQDEWQHASVKDPFVSSDSVIRCQPVTHEDRKAAEQNELILNYQFCRQFNRYRFMTDVVKLFYKEGTVVVKSSWRYEDEVVKEKMPIYAAHPITGEAVIAKTVEVEKTNVLVNQPDAEVCRLQDIYVDPTCKGDLDKAQFIIHRYETDISTLRKSGKYKNLDKLAKSISDTDEGDYEEEDDTNFKFGDAARKKVLAYEYWGNFDVDNDGIAEPIVCTWVDDVMLQLQSNPLPGKKIPFDISSNNSIPFKTHGEANAELLGDNQKISTAIKRGIMDNMANSNNSQKGIPVGMLDNINKKRFLNGKNFEFNGTAGNLYEGSYNQIPGSVFSTMEMINGETESMVGVKGFSGGVDGSAMGNSARAAGGVLDAVSIRRSDIIRNISETIVKPVMRKWTAYNGEFLKPEEVIRVTNEKFVEVKRDDLDGNIDITVEVSTSEDDARRSQSLSFLLQTLGQKVPQDMLNILMAKIAKLSKMPDLAKTLEEYQPQPDPYVEEMKQLEKQKLIAEIKERMSRATENAADLRLKTANAILAESKAGNLQSDTDLKDMEFTKKAQGDDFYEKMTEKDHDRNTELMKEGAKNKGQANTN